MACPKPRPSALVYGDGDAAGSILARSQVLAASSNKPMPSIQLRVLRRRTVLAGWRDWMSSQRAQDGWLRVGEPIPPREEYMADMLKRPATSHACGSETGIFASDRRCEGIQLAAANWRRCRVNGRRRCAETNACAPRTQRVSSDTGEAAHVTTISHAHHHLREPSCCRTTST